MSVTRGSTTQASEQRVRHLHVKAERYAVSVFSRFQRGTMYVRTEGRRKEAAI